MKQFTIENGKLKEMKLNSFKLEKEIQTLCENNMKELLGLTFISGEFTVSNNFRIDSLAFDEENKSFVIIEYKMKENFSIIDQGYAYLSIMLDNKADFILEYNEKMNKRLRRDDIDWSQSKIIFIAPSFNKFQLETLNFKDVPFEVYKINKYEKDYITFERIKGNRNVSIKQFVDNKNIDKVSREIKVYTEDDHLNRVSSKARELYNGLKERVLELDNVDIEPKKQYIAFKGDKNIVDIEVQKEQLKVYINMKKKELDDPKNMARDVSNIGHWGNGDYEIRLTTLEKIDYLMFLIKQSWEKNKK